MADRQERRWIWGFSLVLALLTTIPYFAGFQVENASWRFSGLLFAIEDGNSYLAKMMLGASGDWLFRTPFTDFPQRGYLFFLPYILLGKLTAQPGQYLQMVVLFHLFRIAGIFFLADQVYHFLALFTARPVLRGAGTAIVCAGGGLGWLSAAGLGRFWNGSLPLEFYSPETFGFLMVFGLPHLAFARGFLLLGLRRYLNGGAADNRLQELLVTGFVWLALGLMQPLTVVVGWVVIMAHLGFTAAWQKYRGNAADWETWRHYLRSAMISGVLSAPLVLYTLLVFQLEPYLRTWAEQNLILSPPISHYLLAYGMLLPFVLLGIRPILDTHPWSGRLVIGWAAILLPLAYAPFNMQRRLPEGGWVALVVMAVIGIDVLVSQYGSQQRRLYRWMPLLLVPVFFSTLVLLTGGMMAAAQPRTPVFRPAEELAVFDALRAKAEKGDVVLAAYEISNALPAWAPVRVVTGHGPESYQAEITKTDVEAFFAGEGELGDREAFLRAHQVAFVVWRELAVGQSGWNARREPYLQSLMESESYVLFQVMLH